MTQEQIDNAALDYELNVFNGGDPRDSFAKGAKWAFKHTLQFHSMDEEPECLSVILVKETTYDLYVGNYIGGGKFRLNVTAPTKRFDKSYFVAWACFADLFNLTNFDEVVKKGGDK